MRKIFIASQVQRGRPRLVEPPGCRGGIAKHDAILSISGLNSTLELNIDERIVPVMITLIMSLLKHILFPRTFQGSRVFKNLIFHS